MVEKTSAAAVIPRKVALSERPRALRFEQNDRTPVEVTVPPPPTMREMIAQAVGEALSAQARQQDYETAEEADDFDILDEYDDLDWESRYEFTELRPEDANGYDVEATRSDEPLDESESRIASRIQTNLTERSEEQSSSDVSQNDDT